MINVEKIKPTGLFTNYIYKAIPLAFDESMSYYETLCGLLYYLKSTVIPALNNNADAIIEVQELMEQLQNYVDNYFDNLNVQEEINNKLDEMAESGVLEEIMADYLDTRAIFGFDNVADMKIATNLTNGSFARTLGYTNKNDGNGALYKIRTITNEDIVNEINIIALADVSLIAELIINKNEICFNNVADMKASKSIWNGSCVKTLGYYSVNDGGDAEYKIRLKTNEDTPNDMDLIAIGSSLVGEYINNDKTVNPLKFGAKGDGTTDDTSVLQYVFDYANTNGYAIFIPEVSNFYKITDGLIINNGVLGIIYENFDYNGVIRGYGENYTMLTINAKAGFYVKNLSIGGNNRNTINGILFNGQVGLCNFENIRVYNLNGFGFKVNDIYDSVLTNISIELCGNEDEYAFSFNGDNDTCNMTNVNRLQVEQSYYKAIYIDGSTLNCNFNNIHCERTTIDNDVDDVIYLNGDSCNYTGIRIQFLNNDSDTQFKVRMLGTRNIFNNVRIDSHIGIYLAGVNGNEITFNNSNFYEIMENQDQTGQIIINNSKINKASSRNNLILNFCKITDLLLLGTYASTTPKVLNSNITNLLRDSNSAKIYIESCKINNLAPNSINEMTIINSSINDLNDTNKRISYCNFKALNCIFNTNIKIDNATVSFKDCVINGNLGYQAGSNGFSFINNIITGTIDTPYKSIPTFTPNKLTKTDNLAPTDSTARGWIYNGTEWINY